jgi:hypothetical protein
MSKGEFTALVLANQADPALADDLLQLTSETTDDIPLS